jgi:hypothetical protein
MVGRINAKLKVYGNYLLGQLSSAVVQLNGTVGDVTRLDCQLRNAVLIGACCHTHNPRCRLKMDDRCPWCWLVRSLCKSAGGRFLPCSLVAQAMSKREP